MNDKDYLTIKDFADAANVTRQSVYRRMSDILNPYVITVNNRRVLKVEALDVYKLYLNEHGINSDNNDITVLSHENNMLQHENDVLQQQNAELKEQINTLSHDNDTLQHVITSLQKQIELMTAQNTQLQAIIETLTDENKTKNNQIAELQTALKAAQTIQALQLKQLEDRQQEEHKGLFARLFKR